MAKKHTQESWPEPLTPPHDWPSLERQARLQAQHYAQQTEAARYYIEEMATDTPAARARRERLIAVHDQRLTLRNMARMTYLGARAAQIERRGGIFGGMEGEKRAAEASRAGHVIGHFVSAAELLTSAKSLDRLNLAVVAAPLKAQAEQEIGTGLTLLGLQQEHRRAAQAVTGQADYTPPHPNTIMLVTMHEVPKLRRPDQIGILRQLLPYTPQR